MLRLELLGQTGKRIPSRVGGRRIAGTFRLIQILTTARAKPFAVCCAESTAGQGEQHLLAHHIFEQKTALLIIPDFGLIWGNGVLASLRSSGTGAENEVEIALKRHLDRFQAAGAEDLEPGRVMCPQADVVDVLNAATMVVSSMVLNDQVGPTFDRQRGRLTNVRGIIERTGIDNLVKI